METKKIYISGLWFYGNCYLTDCYLTWILVYYSDLTGFPYDA